MGIPVPQLAFMIVTANLDCNKWITKVAAPILSMRNDRARSCAAPPGPAAEMTETAETSS
jgi:hypothetical protein